MITIENADKALKDYYLQAVSAQLNNNVSPFFAAIEKNTDNVYGKDVKVAVVRGNTEGIMACAEDAGIPEPYANRYLQISLPLKNIYGTIEVSDKAMRASRDSSGAFVNLVNAEMEGLVSGAKYNFQRMLYGDGNGTLAKIVSADASASSNFKYTVDNVSKLSVGMKVETVTSASVKTEGLTISAVDSETKTVTFNKQITGTAEGALVTIAGAYGNELTGLGAIFGEGKLYGYDKTEEPYFAPYSKSLSSALTEDDITDVLDHMEEHFNSKINMILCSFSTRKKIAKLAAENRRIVNTIDAAAGFGVVTVNGVPVYADRFCPDGLRYFVNTEDFSLCQLCDWEWLEDEDGKILKQVPGKAAYGATLVKYAELICKKPCAQAVLTNV